VTSQRSASVNRRATPRRTLSQAKVPARGQATGLQRIVDQAAGLATEWGPTAGRILLGLVLAWFGYHELVQPALWTGYIPAVHTASAFAIILVLAHGWLLLVLSVALIAGIAPRLGGAIAALLLLQIVVSLTITAGLSDLTLRDVGVLGLAICLVGDRKQRLVLTG